MRARWLIAVLLTATACATTHISGSPGPGGTGPTHSQLVEKADLRPCPTSASTPVADGLPNVTLACLGRGPEVHLGGLTGKPTVLNIWGSWCVPCQAEARFLSKAYDQDHGRVSFLGVDTEDQADSALDFDAHVSPPVRYPSVFDEDRKVMIGLRVPPSPPLTVLVSAAGKVVHIEHGAYTSTAQIQQDIATYLHVAT